MYEIGRQVVAQLCVRLVQVLVLVTFYGIASSTEATAAKQVCPNRAASHKARGRASFRHDPPSKDSCLSDAGRIITPWHGQLSSSRSLRLSSPSFLSHIPTGRLEPLKAKPKPRAVRIVENADQRSASGLRRLSARPTIRPSTICVTTGLRTWTRLSFTGPARTTTSPIPWRVAELLTATRRTSDRFRLVKSWHSYFVWGSRRSCQNSASALSAVVAKTLGPAAISSKVRASISGSTRAGDAFRTLTADTSTLRPLPRYSTFYDLLDDA